MRAAYFPRARCRTQTSNKMGVLADFQKSIVQKEEEQRREAEQRAMRNKQTSKKDCATATEKMQKIFEEEKWGKKAVKGASSRSATRNSVFSALFLVRPRRSPSRLSHSLQLTALRLPCAARGHYRWHRFPHAG